MIFTLMFSLALFSTLATDPLGTLLSLKLATVISGMLSAACMVTRLARGNTGIQNRRSHRLVASTELSRSSCN